MKKKKGANFILKRGKDVEQEKSYYLFGGKGKSISLLLNIGKGGKA